MVFGDHQVAVTKPFVEAIDGPAGMADPRSLAYRTFFALSGGSEPTGETKTPIDIAFLGNMSCGQPGIPGSQEHLDLARLEAVCEGSFTLAPDGRLSTCISSGASRAARCVFLTARHR